MPQTGNGQKKLPGKPVEFYTIIKKTKTKTSGRSQAIQQMAGLFIGSGSGKGRPASGDRHGEERKERQRNKQRYRGGRWSLSLIGRGH